MPITGGVGYGGTAATGESEGGRGASGVFMVRYLMVPIPCEEGFVDSNSDAPGGSCTPAK